MRVYQGSRSASSLLFQGTEDHVKYGFLAGFELVENRQTGPHGKMIVEVIGIVTGKEDDSVFVQANFRGVLQKLGAVQVRHFQVNNHEIKIIPYRLQSLQRIRAGLHIQKRIIMLYVRTEEEQKGFVIINYQYLTHKPLMLPVQTTSVPRSINDGAKKRPCPPFFAVPLAAVRLPAKRPGDAPSTLYALGCRVDETSHDRIGAGLDFRGSSRFNDVTVVKHGDPVGDI